MEKRSFGVGVGSKGNFFNENAEIDNIVSLSGSNNKGYILTTVNDVINLQNSG